MQPLNHDISMQPFDRFIDTDHMRGIFQERLLGIASRDLLVTRCDILYARYKTFVRRESRRKSYLALCYELEVSDGAGRRVGTQMLYAKAFLDGKSEQRFDAAKVGILVSPRFGEPLIHLPDLDMVIWAFPNDPELPHLPDVIDPQKVLPYLPYDSLPAGVDGPRDLTDVSVEVIHYYPEERCTSRYSLQWGLPEAPRTVTLIGKTFKDKTGQEVYRRLRQLWQSAQEQPEGFAVAQPLSYDSRVKTVWQEAVPGVPAISLMSTARRKEWLVAIAKGLARLHQSPSVSSTTLALSDHLEDLRTKTEKLQYAFPVSQKPLELLRQSLEQSAPRLTPAPRTFIHGDFHLRQLLVHEGKVVFLDFDECGLGDPLQDLASFIVDLHFYDFSAADVQWLGATFLRAYKEQIGWEVPLDRLNWHLRMQFVTKAYRAYRQYQPDREERVRYLLALAQRGACFETQPAMVSQ